jgi:hypothetical protein
MLATWGTVSFSRQTLLYVCRISTLKMEAISSSETSGTTLRTTRRHIPENDTLLLYVVGYNVHHVTVRIDLWHKKKQMFGLKHEEGQSIFRLCVSENEYSRPQEVSDLGTVTASLLK